MVRYDFGNIDKELGILYVGTAREIRSLYKNLERKTSAIPLFVDDPVIVKDRMYGIYVQPNGFYTVENANTCLAMIVSGTESNDISCKKL